jgi:hypothetical protein
VLGCAECPTLGKLALYRAQDVAECGTRQSLLCRVPDKKHSAKPPALGKGANSGSECKHAFRKPQCYYTVDGQSLTRRINVQKQNRQVKNRGGKKNFLKRKRKNYIEQFSLFFLGSNPNHSILMKCRAVPHLYGAQCESYICLLNNLTNLLSERERK